MRTENKILAYEKYVSPCPEGYGYIYGYYKKGELVYIGQTTQAVQKRYYQHTHTDLHMKPGIDNLDEIFWFEVPREELDLYETILINAYNPIYNKKAGKHYPANTSVELLGFIISHYCDKEYSDFLNMSNTYFINPNDLYVDPMKMAAYEAFIKSEEYELHSIPYSNLWILNNDRYGLNLTADCRFFLSLQEMVQSHSDLRGFPESIYVIPLEEVVDNVDSIHELGCKMDNITHCGGFHIYGYNQRTKKLVGLWGISWHTGSWRANNHIYKYDIRNLLQETAS